MSIEESKKLILVSLAKGVQPNYATVGGNDVAIPAFAELLAEGQTRWVRVPSKSGKRMIDKLVAA